VIAGGGVAALEAALALHDLAGEHVNLTVIAPNEEFVYRPMSVREPFAHGAAARYPIDQIVHDIGATLLPDSFAWIDAPGRVAHTEAGEAVDYDALILALGARSSPRYEHAVTVDDRQLDELLHGLIQDVEGGYLRRVAFVVPPRMAWPLPIYELALMTARRAYDMNVELAVTIATPERAPLEVFGDRASQAVSQLLADRGITTITDASCEVPDGRHVIVNPGRPPLAVDRVVALPELFGPAVRGLHAGDHGFIPIDSRCRVRGVDRVYAAGDATDFPVKHGGLAAQQADTAARAIAGLAGLPVEATWFRPVIQGVLLTGAAPLQLSADLIGGKGFGSAVSETAPRSPPAKIAARYLAPYLAERDRVSPAA